MFGEAKHTFRAGAVWNAHLECVMALRDPKYQKSNKLGFWTQPNICCTDFDILWLSSLNGHHSGVKTLGVF